MWLVKLPFKILALPVILALIMLRLFMIIAGHCSALVIGPFALFIFGCIVYSVCKASWLNVGLLSGIATGCVLLFFAFATIFMYIENAKDRHVDFLYS
ncbi:MAG: hypothetical protein EOM00_11165 [Clostridia bacterium]|nr:hypothetical protein [Clostridia bacterium]